MNLIQQAVKQISKENLHYYDTEQAEDELFNMLQSNRLYMMKDRTLDFIKSISSGFYLIPDTCYFVFHNSIYKC